MNKKPFKIGVDYLDWAHSSAAEEGQMLACKIIDACQGRKIASIEDPQLVAEIADVAQLYLGGDDEDKRARRAFNKAVAWLRDNGFPVWKNLLKDLV